MSTLHKLSITYLGLKVAFFVGKTILVLKLVN